VQVLRGHIHILRCSGTPPQKTRQPPLNGNGASVHRSATCRGRSRERGAWYDEERPGSPIGFSVMSIGRSCASASGHSNSPQVAGNVRRALLHTFPYAVYFRASDEMVAVLAGRTPALLESTSTGWMPTAGQSSIETPYRLLAIRRILPRGSHRTFRAPILTVCSEDGW
jgi:hypothetical protein